MDGKRYFVGNIHGHFSPISPASLLGVSAVIARELWWMNLE
jgi:hypothetical protein